MRLGALRNNDLFSEAEPTSPAHAHSKPRHVWVGLAGGAVISTERLNHVSGERYVPVSCAPRPLGGAGGVGGFPAPST